MLYFWIAGACALGSVLVIMALSRRRRCSYEEHCRALEERIQACEDSIREDTLRMSAQEHMDVARAAVAEMLALDSAGAAWALESGDLCLRLCKGREEWRLEAEDVRPRQLRHRGRVLCAPSGWRLCEVRGGETLSARTFPQMDMALANLQAALFPALAEKFLPPAREGNEACRTDTPDTEKL